jgi:GxxExxY protein
MNTNELTSIIIGCAIKVHKNLGPGLLESAYKECLKYELEKTRLHIKREKPIPIIYKSIQLDYGYRIDLLVENQIVIEIKSVELINDVHIAQTLTYLKIGNFKLGLLINFNVVRLTDGLRRLIL